VVVVLGHPTTLYPSVNRRSLTTDIAACHTSQHSADGCSCSTKPTCNASRVGSIVGLSIGQRLRPLSYTRHNTNIATSPVSRGGNLQAGSAAKHVICMTEMSVSNIGRSTNYIMVFCGFPQSEE
jgi:hypothetical protein